ncbi:LAMI_0F08504g1_1 [Lachancea mirantina]|uniref:LAMI_0F08504g1_1 n=1 Tax=Lachancea mirantina TaxID=1230905 RepID=A0A1G4K0H1_9SACH|nr:LAMI_0F08504g1_1 [Lachancea mirantina]
MSSNRSKKPSSSKGHAAGANKSVLSLTSPAKLNVISQDWSRMTSKTAPGKIEKRQSSAGSLSNVTNIKKGVKAQSQRPSLHHVPPLLRHSSSFFKDDADVSESRLPISQESEDVFPSTDRFIPLRKENSFSLSKLEPSALEEEVPPPSASPSAHLRAQTKRVFKQNVAEACGLDIEQRILQYVPKPPPSSFNKNSYSISNRSHYSYSSKGSSATNGELAKLRKVNSNPERILDAPGFQDDFYLNLLSWSNKNVLAIALDSALYLWNGDSGDVTLLVDYEQPCAISSVTWSDDDCHLSIGKNDGNVEIWDVETSSHVRTMRSGLGVRIGSQSWLDTLIATGAKSGEIHINDVRIKNHIVSTWDEHRGEVCGLSYRPDGLQLASGSNDNTVVLWDTRTSLPQQVKRQHTAAVKALAWCPDVSNLLATGGGQTDKHIHFWNTTTGARIGSINTGSQVSSLNWGQSSGSSGMQREIAATGGNPENAISIYNYDTKFKVAEIVHAHEARICSSHLSPDGTTLATVGGDENLKFFKIFDSSQRRQLLAGDTDSILGLLSCADRCNDDSSRSPSKRKFSDFLIR